ncbi:hypothetical protein F2P81_018333 [Scophthalmus maximus]|uniref:Uncharacterized protein n=1 Tax=Scophthalmus maximus TaxID=52904 RepID=A0A6A4SAE1_SCOMX|nr:hypothetical protein F2P81_018333 [Scophthalmus maximus]
MSWVQNPVTFSPGRRKNTTGQQSEEERKRLRWFLRLDDVSSVDGCVSPVRRLDRCTLLPCSVLTALGYFAVSCQSLNIDALCLNLSALR